MKAMVFAAGMGTRLRPLTDDRPKALVTVAGQTMLEMVLARLRQFGVTEAIVNTHHHAAMIAEYLAAHQNFGMRIEISHEEELLDTGGGLKKAAWFFLDGKEPDDPSLAPFLVHNVDIVSTIDLARMIEFHKQQNALATIAGQDRATHRYLLFDEQGGLCGRRYGREGELQLTRPAAAPYALAYSCIQVITPRLFATMTEDGAFSIIDAELRMAAQGEKIISFRADGAYWRDLGTPESVAKAAQEAAGRW